MKPRIKEYMMSDVITVSPRRTIEEASQLMRDYGVRHLPVIDDQVVVGVLSERDIALAWSQNANRVFYVEDAMTTDPYAVDPEAPLSEVLEVMAANRLGCVLVKGHGDRMHGIFTTTDALMLLARVFERTDVLRSLQGV